MPKYLTVAQYKQQNDGVSLSDVSDLTLASIIKRAETAIDAHMGFDAKRGGFEPHIVTTQHAFRQDDLKTLAPMTPIPLRNIQRYRIQVSNVASSGAGFFANISPDDCVINNDGQYVEIVPLQAVTYSLSPILIQLGLRPPIIEMDAEIGYYISALGEQFVDSGNQKTYYALSGFWAQSYTLALHLQPNTLPPVPPIIYKNGTVVTSGYIFNAVEGSVTFTSANAVSDVVSGDYTKTIPDFVQAATIAQVTFMLGQRALNKMGLQGIEGARTGDQELRRPKAYPSKTQNGRPQQTALCKESMDFLWSNEQIGIC